MPSTILTDLAPELLIQILKSSDTFADVTSLSTTSRKMFTVWKTNVDAICEAILPRTIDCFEQACELLAAQEKAEGDEHVFFGYLTAVDRVKWMLEGAGTAAKALVCYEESVIDHHVRHGRHHFGSIYGGCAWSRTPLTPTERMYFLRAYYRATTLATLAEGLLPCELLSSWDMLAFEEMKYTMYWKVDWCPSSKRLELGMEYPMDIITSHTPRAMIPRENWTLIHNKTESLYLDMIELLPSQTNLDSDIAALSSFYQKSTISNRGARLSDLLPLVRERGYYCNNIYELSNP